METVRTLAALAADKEFHPTDATWVGIVLLVVGIPIAVAGVGRNETKNKAGVAMFGLAMVVVGALLALFTNNT